MTITETKLKSLHGKRRDNTIEIPDRDGLVVSFGKSGKASWVYRYRYQGKQRRLVLGSYPALELKDARIKLAPFIREVEEGRDPKFLIIDQKFISMEYATEQWLAVKVSELRHATATLYKSRSGKYMTNDRFPHDVQKARFEYWLAYFDRIAKETSRVNSGAIFKTVNTMLKWCRSRNIIQSSVLFDMTLESIGTQSKRGERNLSMAEVGKLWIEINKTKATPAIKSCIKLLLIFGARNSEIRAAKREEFDLNLNMWVLPSNRSKTGKQIRRPIPSLAKQIIFDLDQTYGEGGFLIPGAHRNTCMDTHSVSRITKRTWGKLHTQYNTESFTVHDFRRTVSTRLSEVGVLPHVTEKMLGHELGGIMAVYNKHDWIDEQITAYEQWCEMIKDATQKELSGNL